MGRDLTRVLDREQPKRERLAMKLPRATIASPLYHEDRPHDDCEYIRKTQPEQPVLSIDTGFFWTFSIPRSVLQDEAVRPQISTTTTASQSSLFPWPYSVYGTRARIMHRIEAWQ